jgi:hypothetical protein
MNPSSVPPVKPLPLHVALYPFSFPSEGTYPHEARVIAMGDSPSLIKIQLDCFIRRIPDSVDQFQSNQHDCMMLYRKDARTCVRVSLDDDDVSPIVLNHSRVLPHDFSSPPVRVIWFDDSEPNTHKFILSTRGPQLMHISIADFRECRFYAASNLYYDIK